MAAINASEMKIIKDTLSEINERINLMLQHVHLDFMVINEVVQQSYRDMHPHLKDAVECETSMIIVELQYYDILKQKLDHVSQIHHWIIAGEIALPDIYNFFRLNQLQIYCSCKEFLNSTEKIKMLLTTGNLTTIFSSRQMLNLFKESDLVINLSFEINEMLGNLIPAQQSMISIKKHRQALNQLYSMESERKLLKLLLKKPDIHEREVFSFLSNTLEDSSNKTELF